MIASSSFGFTLFRRLPSLIVKSRLFSTNAEVKPVSSNINITPQPQLTQKEYLIAIRNRLFTVEEQIWLHEYATARTNKVAIPKLKGGPANTAAPPSPTSGDANSKKSIEPLSESKYDELLRARGELLDEYPLTKLYTDLYDAQKNNLTYAAIYLDRLINNYNRQLPIPLEHVNQIAVLSFSGQVMNLMRGQGALYHHLLPANVLTEPGVKRQFQHPAFSTTGKYVAFAELHFKADNAGFVRSDALVFEVPKDPKTYGATDSSPLFDSGELPGAPFFLRFSPDEESLAMLCTSPAVDGGQPCTAIVLLEWGKYFRRDSWAGQAAAARFAPRKALTLIQGNPVFFTYTTASAKNATIVAHCQKEVVNASTGIAAVEKAVWMLQRQDTGGVRDFSWNKISDSDPQQRWSTPICHSAGGGDNVLVVEDGFLTSKALSRWKRSTDAAGAPQLASKRLRAVKGQVQFLVAPDGSKAVVLEEDVNTGHYALTVIDGEDALDPGNSSLGTQYELPQDKLTIAFWFSPDSTKLLCLTAQGKSKEDVTSQKSAFKVGLNSEMQWTVFNFPLQELGEYDSFKPTPYFMKTYVPFFSQYAQVYNPWAPDSRSFIYMTAAGLSHTPLVGSKYCLGMDRWQNQGATFGTWSRQ